MRTTSANHRHAAALDAWTALLGRERVQGGLPEGLHLRPATVRELQGCVRIAARHGVPLSALNLGLDDLAAIHPEGKGVWAEVGASLPRALSALTPHRPANARVALLLEAALAPVVRGARVVLADGALLRVQLRGEERAALALLHQQGLLVVVALCLVPPSVPSLPDVATMGQLLGRVRGVLTPEHPSPRQPSPRQGEQQ